MNDRHALLTAREAEAWTEFEELVAAVPPERWETPDFPGGWSLKDVLWHVRVWWEHATLGLERGDFDAEDDEDTDTVNAREQARSSQMSWGAVVTEVDAMRERLRKAWSIVPEVTDEAADLFIGETIRHYAEHRPYLMSLAASA
jgi:hypothetical protein